jgi:hypothetical protein
MRRHVRPPVSLLAALALSLGPIVLLNAKPALREVVVRAYDYALDVPKGLSDLDYQATTRLAGRKMPRWRVFALAHEHSAWTRGELVSYFRRC